jgi:hypothetical protein
MITFPSGFHPGKKKRGRAEFFSSIMGWEIVFKSKNQMQFFLFIEFHFFIERKRPSNKVSC